MEPLAVAQKYFDAWNRRDSRAIVAAFAEGGTYSDPTTGGALSGQAIAAYAGGLWSAFPDLSFEIASAGSVGASLVAAQWIMRGSDMGGFRGLPPTGRSVVLPGADFIRVENDKIRSVEGYFDPGAVAAQLGLSVVVQPNSVGPFNFGTAAHVQSGNLARPGAFSITALQVRSEDEVEQVRNFSRQIATEMLRMPGFIGWVGVILGHRMLTITAWENAEQPRALMRGGTHEQAVRKFFRPELAAGGYTSVWSPSRINAVWVRCPACGQMSDVEQGGKCRCGAVLPQPPAYW